MTYDTVGNPLSMNITFPAVSPGLPTNHNGTWSATYDPTTLQQTSEVRTGNVNLSYNYTFGFDLAGNMTNARGVSFPANANNQINKSGYVYDNEGSPATYQGSTLTYDRENRITSVPGNGGNVTMGWRGDGKRAWRLDGGKYAVYLYDGDTVLCQFERVGTAQPTLRFVTFYGLLGLTNRYTPTTDNIWPYDSFCFDPFGNTTHRVEKDSTIRSVCFYDSRGDTIGEFLATGSAYQFKTIVDSFGPLCQWGTLSDE